MEIKKEEKLREEFRNILYILSQDQDFFKDETHRSDMNVRLESLYYPSNKGEQFRHYYSDIFSVLTSIQKDPTIGSIDILGQNLSEIRKTYHPKNKDKDGNLIDISDNIRKLFDHVSLDIARITYSDKGDRAVSGEESISQVRSQINEIENAVKGAKIEQDSLKEDISKQQREYISILGIFAAVVLAFTGSIAFSSSVLNNINSTNPYRIVIVSLTIGLVVINILFGLFYYIDKLVNTKDNGKIRPLLLSNIIMVVMIIITLVAWCFGIVERRNAYLESRLNCKGEEEQINISDEEQSNMLYDVIMQE